MSAATRGKVALEAKNFEQAIECFTQAISESPRSPLHHIHRSTAYQRAKQLELALADAEKAVVLADVRERRELAAQAQLRRAIAFFHLRRIGDAKACVDWSKELDPKAKTVGIWEKQIAAKLATLPQGDEAANVSVLKVPKGIPIPEASKSAASPPSEHAKTASPPGVKSFPPPVAPRPAAPAPTAKEKIRHEWYQNNEHVYFTILAKGVPKDDASIRFGAETLDISFPVGSESTFEYSIDPLFAPIDPALSTFKVLSTKIEITLKKAVSGHKWKSMEGSHDTTATNIVPQALDPVKMATIADAKQTAPAYPTSSRTGPKNWDKITADELSKSKDAKSENAGDDSDEDGPDGFFKKLYAGASDEAKRAMNKSYSESGGTTLSTNWADIGNRKLEVDAPEGMEVKKW